MDFSDETPLAMLVAGYPRPMLCRRHWATLNGPWELAADPDDVGVRQRWFAGDHPFTQTVQVPFPTGSESSGVSAGLLVPQAGHHPRGLGGRRRTHFAHQL